MIGRTDGPDFAAAELARLTYLAATAASRVAATSPAAPSRLEPG